MQENKTKPTSVSIDKFLKGVDETKRADSYKLIDMMKKISKHEPKMWGPSMIGFGSYHYKYESGREGAIFNIGFSPRKPQLVIYAMGGVKQFPDLLKSLGKHKMGGGCLYIKKLADVDLRVLNELLKKSFAKTKGK